MFELGLILFTAHVLGDFLFQSARDVDHKSRPRVFLKHIAVHALLAYILVGIWCLWWLPLIVGLTHALIDGLKLRASRDSQPAFWLDQAAHLLVIGLLVWLIGAVEWTGSAHWLGEAVGQERFLQLLVLISGAVLTVRMSGILIRMWVRPWLEELLKETDALQTLGARGLEKGGSVIGQLERILIFLLVLTGEPEAVGFLVAAKSIFRFGELRDTRNRKEAEYITIGTLMSFACGLTGSWITVWLMQNLG